MRLSELLLEEAIEWFATFGVSYAVAEFVYQEGLIPSPDRFPNSISDDEIEILYTNIIGMSTLDFGQLLAISRYNMPEGDVITILDEDDNCPESNK